MEIQQKVEKICTFKPEINQYSSTKNKPIISSEKALTERLYEIDISKRKEKKKALENIYSHYFTPMTNTSTEVNDTNDRKNMKLKNNAYEINNIIEKYKSSQNDEEIDQILKEKIVSKSKFDLYQKEEVQSNIV